MTEIITYPQMQEMYKEFKNNRPKDEFEAYVEELSYLRSLIELANENNKKWDAMNYKVTKSNVIKKLKDMGFEVEDD